MPERQKPIEVVPVQPPPPEQRVRRDARFAGPGEKRSRYSMPVSLDSASPVGFRTRVALTRAQAEEIVPLLSLSAPKGFAPPEPVTDRELFEEVSLGLLTARQSTNFRGHRQVTLGPDDSAKAAELLRRMKHARAPVLDGAAMTHVVFYRPYRTAFTKLLTVVGHRPVASLLTVPIRALRKRLFHADDIPTIGYLTHLHLGVLGDQMERAAVIASRGRRRARIHVSPFTSEAHRADNAEAIEALYRLCGVTPADRRKGWRVALVAQVGLALPDEVIALSEETCVRLGANLMALRSERIQPGVNQEDKAPAPYQHRQDMDVPDELTVMAGRAAYNAFAHWTGVSRERAKELLLLERIDVLTPNGKERLREVRDHLGRVTDKVVAGIPKWADLPTGRYLSRSAARGRKAFALAGQRIYIGGLSRPEIEAEGIEWNHAVRAFGAAAARSALVAELMGLVDLPDDCDLLAGICLMAGPVNQNDVGKQFFGEDDLLAAAFPGRDPTSLLLWTLKAKTVADPIGNEEQLLNRGQKGALVDLRPGPHEVVGIRRHGRVEPMRQRGDHVSRERAFASVGNFVVDPDGREIPGNRGEPWPGGDEVLWV